MDFKYLLSILVCGTTISAVLSETCKYYDKYEYYNEDGYTMDCPSGCCGDKYNRYCCDNEDVAVVVGVVFGCLTFVVVILVIVCIACYLMKRPHRTHMTSMTIRGFPLTQVRDGIDNPTFIETRFMEQPSIVLATTSSPTQPVTVK